MENPAAPVEDPLLGTAVAGRYQLCRLADQDSFGPLYSGVDNQTGALIGVRIVTTPQAHTRLHSWLAQALLSRGREAILAVGHLDRDRSYVVFAEAALAFLRPLTDEPGADETAEGGAGKDAENGHTEQAGSDKRPWWQHTIERWRARLRPKQ